MSGTYSLYKCFVCHHRFDLEEDAELEPATRHRTRFRNQRYQEDE